MKDKITHAIAFLSGFIIGSLCWNIFIFYLPLAALAMRFSQPSRP